jgi:hypothetical protein
MNEAARLVYGDIGKKEPLELPVPPVESLQVERGEKSG